MLEAIQPYLETYGYWVIALIILLENAGLPLPGETTLILAGVLAHQGTLSFPLVLLAAITGAIVGDNCGYFIGRRYGRDLVLKFGKNFGLSPAKFAKAEEGFLKNSSWAVFFGRFIVLLRVLAGPLAGITQMPWPKFFLFNAMGAIAWASAIGTASYIFGQQVETFFKDLGIWALVIAVVLVIGFSITRTFIEERKLEREIKEAEKKAESTTTPEKISK
jgi:membrane protein DedA with SNARE-associated domain